MQEKNLCDLMLGNISFRHKKMDNKRKTNSLDFWNLKLLLFESHH